MRFYIDFTFIYRCMIVLLIEMIYDMVVKIREKKKEQSRSRSTAAEGKRI